MGPLLHAPKATHVCSHHEACLQNTVYCASDVSFNVKNTWDMHQPSKKRCGIPTSFRCNSHPQSGQPGPQKLNQSIPMTPLHGHACPLGYATWSDEDYIGRVSRTARKVHNLHLAVSCIKRCLIAYKREWQRNCPRG